MKTNVYIVEGKRTAIAKYGGDLTNIPITLVTALLIQGLLKNYPKLSTKIDEVILGNVLSAGLGQNPARIVAYKATGKTSIPAFTINKVCGSGLKSIALGASSIQNEDADLILAGGMESMSNCPYYLDSLRFGAKFGHQTVRDGMIYDGLFCSLIGEHMGITAENIAKKYHLSREVQDRYALDSQKKALLAIKENRFKEEIIPLTLDIKHGTIVFKQDEQPRPDCNLEKLSNLKPAFKKNGTVTAGNSSSLNDGAAVVLLMSEKALKKYKLRPKALVRNYATAAIEPKYMGLGAYYAAVNCLRKSGLKKEQIDLWEINEAFASQSLAVIQELDISPKLVNVNGGAIALGHPIGASGARILVTLLAELKKRKQRYGLATLCIGGGQGIAMLIENI